MAPKTKEADRSSPVIDTGNSMARAPTQEPAPPDARVPPPANARKGTITNKRSVPPRVQSKSSQMTPKTKGADRSSPVTDTGNSMARAPTQEPASSEARVLPSASARKESHRPTMSQGEYPGREGLMNLLFPRLNARMNNDREEEHITQETSRETRETDVQDGTSSQQMNSNIRSTRPGRRDDSRHQNRHGQIHDEPNNANVREDVDDGVANEGGGGEGEREVKEAEGSELSTNQSLHPSPLVRKPYNRRESARDAIFHLEGSRRKSENDGTSSQQMNRNLSKTHSRRGDDSGRHSHHGESHEESRDAILREDVDDGGINEGEGGEGGREEKEAEGNKRSKNQSLPASNPARSSVANGGEQGGQGEKEEKEAEGNEHSTNQDLRPSNPAHRSHYRRESARDALIRLEGTLRRRERDVNLLSTRNEELSDEIKILKEELTHLQLERNQTERLLHERTVELSSAQLFLGKADTVSVTDVSSMVDVLNAEISQASNSIADSLSDNQVTLATPDTTELNRLLHKERSSIGARLCDILARRLCPPSTEFDPMITQLALQAGLSKACYRIINDWNPPSWDSSSTVNRMYVNMRPSVGQVIAGRWRALARTYRNGQDSGDGIQGQDAKEGIQEANADYLISTLRDLLTIVGWSPGDSHHDLPSGYKEKMRFLSDKALKLHETIGQGITSKDLIVDLIPCETPFDPTQMDNADRQRGKPEAIFDATVACTVELGLRYSANPVGDLEETGVILKPKVLLTSVLVEEDREDTPPKPQD